MTLTYVEKPLVKQAKRVHAMMGLATFATYQKTVEMKPSLLNPEGWTADQWLVQFYDDVWEWYVFPTEDEAKSFIAQEASIRIPPPGVES